MKKLLLLAIIAFSLDSCRVYKEVEVKEVLDVQVLSFDEKGAECEIYLTVENPNNYKITLTETHVDLIFEGKPLGEVEVIEKTVIPKMAQSTIKLKCIASSDNIQVIAGDFFTLLFKSEFTLEGKGYIRGKALMVSKTVPVEFKENIKKEDFGL
ncbi:MAG: LEA type 2 family protein [Flavobacteriales bacterium]|nr:LEA type 2 family protein [Flavobacteriales bacterium]